MSAPQQPTIRPLEHAECLELLARNNIGRVAFTFQNHVDIQPLNYVLEGEWLFGRTSAGRKLATVARNWWVAFEVDEIEGLLDWRSVVVRGGFYRLSPEGPRFDVELYHRAVAALRTLIPETFTHEDPVSFRAVVFGIALQAVSGRASTTHARNV